MVDIVNKDDGGSAFPNAPLYALQEEDGVYELLVDEQSSGMTLRDYFAAKAMQSLLSRLDIDEVPTTGSNQFTSICLISYFVATEMMKAREA